MRSQDPLLSYTLATEVAEVGSGFHISISRSPADGETNDKTFGKARSVRVELRYETDGRGDRDSGKFGSYEVPLDRFGMGSADLFVEIPPDAPISYDGVLMRIQYVLRIRTDLQISIDHGIDLDVVVAPTGGAGTYRYPHPLTSGTI